MEHGPAAAHAMNILVLSGHDRGGGANEVAWGMVTAYRTAGHRCALAVGRKLGDDPETYALPDRGSGLGGTVLAARDAVAPVLGRVRGAGRLHDALHCLGRPRRLADRRQGIEDWTLPACANLLGLAPFRPDIVHAHNLHSWRGPMGHFDLGVLPDLSRRVPVVLTLHDAWLTTGHCAHPLGCDRWKAGCGQCPDLTLYPPVRRDATAANWRRKQQAWQDSRLFVATPSSWLMTRIQESILAPAIVDCRVIPNSVDLSVFHPGNQAAARAALDLPADAAILMFAAQGVKDGSWKDYATLRTAVARIAEALPDRAVLFVALGEDAPPERVGRARIRFVPFQRNAARVADYYRAADLYLHAARVDTFPLTVLEALACGTPAVATAVGGIPEQIASVGPAGGAAATDATGALVPAGDADAMAGAASRLLGDGDVLARLGANAVRSARERFDLDHQAQVTLDWYREVMEMWRREAPPPSR